MTIPKYNNSYQPKNNNSYSSNGNNTYQSKSNNVNSSNGNNTSSPKGNNVNSSNSLPYAPGSDDDSDEIASGFNESLRDQREAYQLSKRNKLDDMHNKAVLKGIDNASGYI